MMRALLRGAVFVTVVVAVSGCGESPAPPTAAEVKRDKLIAELEAFRVSHQEMIDKYEYVRDAKKQLRALLDTIDPASVEDRMALSDAAWEVLSRGEHIVVADYWMLWILKPECPPPSGEIVKKICAKIEARAKAKLDWEVEGELCVVFFETLSRHVPGAPKIKIHGPEFKIYWDKWAEFRKVLAAYEPPSPRLVADGLREAELADPPQVSQDVVEPVGKERQDRFAAEIEKFRLAHQRIPDSYSPDSYAWIQGGAKELSAIEDTLGIDFFEDEPAGAYVMWEILGRGDVLSYADFLVVWEQNYMLNRIRPHSRQVVEGICAKIEARAKAHLPPKAEYELTRGLVGLLIMHVKGANRTGLWHTDKFDWGKWPEFKRAALAYEP